MPGANDKSAQPHNMGIAMTEMCIQGFLNPAVWWWLLKNTPETCPIHYKLSIAINIVILPEGTDRPSGKC